MHFVVTERGKPIQFVECKWSDADIDHGLRYLRGKFPAVDAWQILSVYTIRGGHIAADSTYYDRKAP